MGGAVLMGNQGHLILQTRRGAESPGPAHSNLSEPRPAPDHQQMEANEEVFKLQFAATQYKSLVSKVKIAYFISPFFCAR
jgi:hypothetical protein